MQKTVKMTLKGKTSRKWASGQNIYDFEEEINPSRYSDFCPWAIYIYMTWYISQISGEHLQDHWSPGCNDVVICALLVCLHHEVT